jgi:hypothetical protein
MDRGQLYEVMRWRRERRNKDRAAERSSSR